MTAVFYYDLGSPACYLVAEQIGAALPEAAEWEPVHASGGEEFDRAAIEHRAAELALQPVRWPPEWPPDTRAAMLAATYAKQIGRTVAFSMAAFRQAFAGGRDLGDEDTVLIAAAACEMHPAAVLKGISLRSTATALDRAVHRARAAGVRSVPAIQVGDEVFYGLEAAVGAYA
ncbi:MAG TPA: DsbA family protein [Solirubrobacteraceae bacterium]|nr:DsbA family protein [Solirubrobacteraceae bacterium]